MRDTSIEAYEKIREDGTLSRMRWRVYQHLFHHGPLTAREVDHGLSSPGDHAASYHKRLSELEQMGVVATGDERECSITGMRCLTWDVTSLDTPIPYRPAARTRSTAAQRRVTALEEAMREAIRDLRAINDMFTSPIAHRLEAALNQTNQGGRDE
jgi:hypothetical protein